MLLDYIEVKMEITNFSRKFICLMQYDKPLNSLPIILFSVLFILVEISMCMALLIEPSDLEKTLLIVIDTLMLTIVSCQIFKRKFNNEEMINLLDLIESDFAVSQDELKGRDMLWLRIHEFYHEKRNDMREMNKKLSAVFMMMGGLFCNRNVLNYLFGLTTDSENDSNWPTPYLSYCPPELRSTAFFICTYILQSLLMLALIAEGFVTINLVCLSSERVLADFQTLFILLDDFVDVFQDLDVYDVYRDKVSQVNQCENINYNHKTEPMNLRRDMALIVRCHQTLDRNFRVCFKGSGGMISIMNMVIMLYSCTAFYLMFTTNEFNKRVNFAASFILVILAIFLAYHNGQQILNQNDTLRRALSELPWTDKPEWFKKNLHIMMTRASVDIEMRPYGVYTLNYMSFKDLMKTAFSIGNILYSRKLRSQTQH